MSESSPLGPELPDPPYKSYWRNKALASLCLDYGRDTAGRFLPRFSGSVCDRMGCTDGVERHGARFCATHRQAHGRRLQGQLAAAVEHHRTVTAPAYRRLFGGAS